VLADERQRVRALATDREFQGLDVLPLPPVERDTELARPRGGRLREGAVTQELETTGSPDVSQREVRIGGAGAVEPASG